MQVHSDGDKMHKVARRRLHLNAVNICVGEIFIEYSALVSAAACLTPHPIAAIQLRHTAGALRPLDQTCITGDAALGLMPRWSPQITKDYRCAERRGHSGHKPAGSNAL